MRLLPRPARAAGLAVTAVLTATVALTGPPASAQQPAPVSPVTRWAERHATDVPADLDRPGRDLAAISRATAGAQIIGLGEPGHLIGEVTALQFRYVRHLVTHGGVRALAVELDWTLGIAVNDYLLGRRDDLDAVLAELEVIWRTREVRDTLLWLRAYNDGRPDDVTLAGVEYFATGLLAYDAVEAYVAARAPARLPELNAYYELLEPETDDIGAHLWDYMAIENKEPYVTAAAALHDLVAELDDGTDEDEIVLQHARQIHWWYEGFSQPWDDIPTYRDTKAAENVRWWQRNTGARTIYWAASAHVADAPRLTITEPGEPDTTFAAAGSHLADWYGPGYVPVGFTFDHGTYAAGGAVVELPPARPDWFEFPLGAVRSRQFVLPLDRPAPRAVREWLDAPLVTRGLPEYGDRSVAYGGTLREWFDVLVHTQEVSPAHPL